MPTKQVTNENPLTPQQACGLIGISRAHLFRLIREGRLAVFRPGPRILRFQPQDVMAFIASCKTPATRT
jgi:excisionase family DNA binding protein